MDILPKKNFCVPPPIVTSSIVSIVYLQQKPFPDEKLPAEKHPGS